MSSKLQIFLASFLLFCMTWSSSISMAKSDAVDEFSAPVSTEGLKRPTRPDIFTDPAQVRQYVKDMHEYLRAKSIRYGKRFAPQPKASGNGMDDLQTAEIINELNKHQLESLNENIDGAGFGGGAVGIDEENPQEQVALQQMRPMKETNLYRLLTQIPLPLLAKYLHINQIMNQDEINNGNVAFNTNIRRTMLHPFVRQRFISVKQKPNDF